MPKKIVEGEFKRHKFVVENTWLGGLKFFHNEKLIGINNNLFAIDKNKAIISAKIMIEGVERIVEVFVIAFLTVKIQIRVDGIIIAGDKF